MPRLPTSLLRRARAIDTCLVSLLPICRDLPSAQNELRWLREHVEERAIKNGVKCSSPTVRHELKKLCQERGRGKPLQYILGSEWFGDLELLCRPGVLIPRPETADSIEHLVRRFRFRRGARALGWHLRILDLCTGSGCMSLLLHHTLHKTFRKVTTETLGLDVSNKALKLARDNLKHVGLTGETSTVRFERADVLANDDTHPASVHKVLSDEGAFDIIVANPPYISSSAFYKETAKSVRNFEPRLALVPSRQPSSDTDATPAQSMRHVRSNSHPGDDFYPRIAEICDNVNAKLVLMEVGDMSQAKRVASIFASRTTTSATGEVRPVWHSVEIWRDGIMADGAQTRRIYRSGLFHIPIVGPKEITHGRTVVCWRNEAVYWLHTDCYIDGHWHEDEKAYAPWAFPIGSDFRTYSSGSGSRPVEWFNHVRSVREVDDAGSKDTQQVAAHGSPHYTRKDTTGSKD